MIGDSKVRPVITRKEFIKVIRKNAKRGFFNTTPAPVPKVKPDTVIIPRDTVTATIKKVEPTPEAPILKADSLVTLNEFLFETDSYKLRTEHFSELDLLSRFLQSRPTLEVAISGHTDNAGDERHNVTLSTQRAKVVAEYLVSKGVDYDRVVFQGLGSSQPIAENETPAGRSKNRRVEILIRNPKK